MASNTINCIQDKLLEIDEIWQTLEQASDGCCQDNGSGKKYIKFDELKKFISKNYHASINNLSSCDIMLINTKDNQIIFVEFKDLTTLKEDELKEWIENKKYKLLLKITESILLLSFFLKAKYSISLDDYFAIKQSYIVVYKINSSANKIHNHLRFISSRYAFFLEKSFAVECNSFCEWLLRC